MKRQTVKQMFCSSNTIIQLSIKLKKNEQRTGLSFLFTFKKTLKLYMINQIQMIVWQTCSVGKILSGINKHCGRSKQVSKKNIITSELISIVAIFMISAMVVTYYHTILSEHMVKMKKVSVISFRRNLVHFTDLLLLIPNLFA